MTKTITATVVLPLESPSRFELVSVSAGAWNDLIVLLRSSAESGGELVQNASDDGDDEKRSSEGSPKFSYQIRHHSRSPLKVIDLPNVAGYPRYCQAVVGDRTARWVLVTGRCEPGDANAELFDDSGRLLRSFHVGDGIAHVQTTRDGRVWVGYGDEGVFGKSMGRNGLQCFDDWGRVMFGYNALAKYRNMHPIADCYALNVVSKDEVWVWYYQDFPLIRIVDGRIVGHWPSIVFEDGVSGSQAFAVARDRALFAGGYHSKNRLYSVSLQGEGTVELSPVDAEGRALRWTRAFGRGPRLYLQSDDALYVIDSAKLQYTGDESVSA